MTFQSEISDDFSKYMGAAASSSGVSSSTARKDIDGVPKGVAGKELDRSVVGKYAHEPQLIRFLSAKKKKKKTPDTELHVLMS